MNLLQNFDVFSSYVWIKMAVSETLNMNAFEIYVFEHFDWTLYVQF